MRVLLIRHGYFPDDPRVHREACALVADGHHVELICLRGQGEPTFQLVDGVEVIRVPLAHLRASIFRYAVEYALFFTAAAAIATARHVRERYELVQVHTMPDGLVFAALIPKLLGAKVILDLHELMPELFASKYGLPIDHPLPRLLTVQERLAVRFADSCLVVSQPCLDRFLQRGLPASKLNVIMNSAEPALFGWQHERKAASGASPTLVSHGTLVRRYGYDTLVRAMTELPRVDLEIIGDGEDRQRLQELAAGLGVDDRIAFMGRLPLAEIARRIVGAEAGIVPNRSDEFTDLVLPTKLLEYVALGVPAVVSRTPAVEAYFDERSVAFFEPGDPADLAKTIRATLENPIGSRDMSARALERYESGLHWPAQERKYLDLVKRLTGGDAAH